MTPTNFRHEAVLYRGDFDFVERVAPFVIEGLTAGEPTLVMVSQFGVSDLGTVRSLVAEHGARPLGDRQRPGPDPEHARGLWTANRLCDLVQLRSSAGQGSVVRLTMHARQAA